jgi:hypothetical protein
LKALGFQGFQENVKALKALLGDTGWEESVTQKNFQGFQGYHLSHIHNKIIHIYLYIYTYKIYI